MEAGGAYNHDDAVNDKHIHDGDNYKGHNPHCHQQQTDFLPQLLEE